MKILVLISYILFLSIMTYWKSNIFINQFYSSKRILILEKQSFQKLRTKPLQISKIVVVVLSSLIALFNIYFATIILLVLLFIIECFTPRIKQKLTRRKYRLLITSLVFIVLVGASNYYLDNSFSFIISVFTSYFAYTIIIISNFILFPIENLIRNHYLKKAKQKIKLNQKLKIIAITGSYGKTSFKRYLHTLLSKKHLCLRSPGSVNTVMGLTKFINNELSPYDEFLILEFGVDSKGGMDKLLKFINPNYGVITAIGPMHLATFKSLENIQKEKLKLAKGLKNEKVLFYNADSVKITADKAIPCDTHSYSLSELKIISVNISGTTILLEGKEYLIPLLGKHQVLNCWGAIKLAMHLGMNFEEITRALAYISPEPHRLSIEQHSDRVIIDDSYNSNQTGMLEAIEVTLKLPGSKAIITPGIIEVGSLSQEINFAIGEQLVGFEQVFIVSNEKEPALLKGYQSAKGNLKDAKVFSSFIEAYRASKKLKIDILLISNDAHKIHIK